MKKYAILADSTVALTYEQAKELNTILIPLLVIHNNKEYLDLETISNDEVKELLAQKEVLLTSQPNLGSMIEFFNKLESENYDHYFVLTLTKHLSGTYSAVNQAVEELGLENVSVIDTGSIGGPVQQALKLINKRIGEGATPETIVADVEALLDDSVIYVYPESLDTLKRGGRISKGAATMASLLKIKPLLYLDKNCESIDKMGTVRTEAKLFALINEDVKKRNLDPENYDVYLLECDGKDMVERYEATLNGYTKFYSELPAVLSAHAGLKTIAIQYVKKIK